MYIHLISSSAWRLRDFQVYVSDQHPPISSGRDLRQEDMCGRYEGTPPTSSTVKVFCQGTPRGTHVYITVPYTDYLVVCEVEVFGEGK